MLSLNNLNTYKEKISKKIDEILLSTSTGDINKLFSSKHHYLFKIRPFNTTQYSPYAYLTEVRMHTENDEQHMTLNKYVSKSLTLSTATIKSTNTKRDDIFDLKISTNSVYNGDYYIHRSWLDGGDNKWPSMPNQNYFTEYEFDCIDLSKFSFCTAWRSYVERYARSCEIVVYIDGEEKYSNIFDGLSKIKSHFSITLNKSGTEIKEVSVN